MTTKDGGYKKNEEGYCSEFLKDVKKTQENLEKKIVETIF